MMKTAAVVAPKRWPLYVLLFLAIASFVRLLNKSNEAGQFTHFDRPCQQLRADLDWDMRNGSMTVTIGPSKAAGTTNRTEGAALCAIVLDAEAYLDEWIDYNLALGFTDIFLYDNSDTFDLEQFPRLLLPTTDSARLHVVHFPGPARQMEAYHECAKAVMARNQQQRQRTTWVAFFDIDEFLVLRQHANVIDFLSQHCPSGMLGINWYMFMTANETMYRPLPVTKRFQYREASINQHVKSIVRLEDMNMEMAPHAHFAYLKKLGQHKDTNGKIIGDEAGHPGPFNPDGPTDVAVLHHYVTKSLKEYVDKTMRGRADIVDPAVPSLNRSVVFQERRKGLDPGATFDDSAWQLLKEKVPKYAIYDYW
jgi:hypothetical protein